ncbi:MAG: putative baseplate assembly protein [Rhodobacteraceae bacterium]|nr:MAG: putative baseplate assembly protein [Paracoccaceae bacterium]
MSLHRDDPGCAHGTKAVRPRNRPGQTEVAYRIGTQPQFMAQMIAAVSADPALKNLRTRSVSDPAIALMDAWAGVLDILSFYQERIANEGWLRTATERRSILELARQIGYELNPGVAASTWLAFTIQASPGGGEVYPMAAGLKVQSIPGPDESPQMFETVETIHARPEWNALRPRMAVPQVIGRATTALWLEGTATGLAPGDLIVLLGAERRANPGSERWDARVLQSVQADAASGLTRVTWTDDLGHSVGRVDPAAMPQVYAFGMRANLFGHNAPDFRAMPEPIQRVFGTPGGRQWANFSITTTARREVDLDQVAEDVLPGSWVILEQGPTRELYRVEEALTRSRADFSLTAKVMRLRFDTDETLVQFGLRTTVVYAQSRALALAQAPLTEPVQGQMLALDGLHPDLFAGQTLILRGRVQTHLQVAPRGRRYRRGTTTVTEPGTPLMFVPQGGGVPVRLSEGEILKLEGPATDEGTAGARLWPVRRADGVPGTVAATGPGDLIPLPPEPPEAAFVPPDDALYTRERVVIRRIDRSSGHAVLVFEDPLARVYWRASVALNGNVALATHGDTRVELTSALTGDTFSETLGSGDASRAMQSFALSQKPLTHVPAATATGGQSTLRVRVDGLLWREVATLYGQPGDARVYMTQVGVDNKVQVQFGDGRFGARLPTGQGNVTASYRIGIGLAGQVRAGQLALAMSQPLGLQAVTNPLPATGAQDPEPLEAARANAPLTVLTLDRVVSVRDFEDFARAFAGVGKAQATLLWSGERQVVHLTVVGADGSRLAPEGIVISNLAAAIDGARHPERRVLISPHTERRFGLRLQVAVDPGRIPAQVLGALRARMLARYGPQGQGLGQGIEASGVIAHAQGCAGVMAVVLAALDGEPPAARPRLLAERARWSASAGGILPAEWMLLDPARLVIEEIQP